MGKPSKKQNLESCIQDLFNIFCCKEDVMTFYKELGFKIDHREKLYNDFVCDNNSKNYLIGIGENMLHHWRKRKSTPNCKKLQLVHLKDHFKNIDKRGVFERICGKHDICDKTCHPDLYPMYPWIHFYQMPDVERLCLYLCETLNDVEFYYMIHHLMLPNLSKGRLIGTNLLRYNILNFDTFEKYRLCQKWMDYNSSSPKDFIYTLKTFFVSIPEKNGNPFRIEETSKFFRGVQILKLHDHYRDIFKEDKIGENLEKPDNVTVTTESKTAVSIGAGNKIQ